MSNNNTKIRLDSIEEAIADIKAGKLIVVVDDEDRENEGDMIGASETITPELVNLMAREGRGLICVSLTEERCLELGLNMMVQVNTAAHETAFTVSVDLLGHGCTTGISASDRSKTIRALIDPATKPEDLGRPGHIFPLKAKQGGVLRRAGHTEASLDFARLAGLAPSGVLVEVLNEDGSMARLPQLRVIADRLGMKLVTIKDLIAYRLREETLIKREIGVDMPTDWGHFDLIAYRQLNTDDLHLALVKGTWEPDEPVLVRVHSSCVTGDIFGSCRCDCGGQLHAAMDMVDKAGKGVVVYMEPGRARHRAFEQTESLQAAGNGPRHRGGQPGTRPADGRPRLRRGRTNPAGLGHFQNETHLEQPQEAGRPDGLRLGNRGHRRRGNRLEPPQRKVPAHQARQDGAQPFEAGSGRKKGQQLTDFSWPFVETRFIASGGRKQPAPSHNAHSNSTNQ